MKTKSSRILKKSLVIAAALQFALLMAFIAPAKAQVANVAVLPNLVTIANVGDTNTADVNITTDVTRLYGYEIMVWYDNSIVNATLVVRPSGHFLEPVDPANQFQVKWEIKNDFNATRGRIYLSYAILNPEAPRNGTGILFRITFKGIAQGTTPIMLINLNPITGAPSGVQGPLKLSDNFAQPIPHTATDGSIEVIPEAIVLMLAVIGITTILAAVFAKKYRRRPI